MILFLVQFEAIFLAIEQSSAESTDKAEGILIFLQFLLVLAQGCELVNDDGPDDLLDDDLDDEQVDEVYEHILDGLRRELIENGCGVVGVACDAGILAEPQVEGKHEAVVQSGALAGVGRLSPIVVQESCKHIGADESEEQHDEELIQSGCNCIDDGRKSLRPTIEFHQQQNGIEEGVEDGQDAQEQSDEIVEVGEVVPDEANDENKLLPTGYILVDDLGHVLSEVDGPPDFQDEENDTADDA